MQCGSSACECLLPDYTVLRPRGQQFSKKDNATGGKQNVSFKFTHEHMIHV